MSWVVVLGKEEVLLTAWLLVPLPPNTLSRVVVVALGLRGKFLSAASLGISKPPAEPPLKLLEKFLFFSVACFLSYIICMFSC